jgi:hypothetical protein
VVAVARSRAEFADAVRQAIESPDESLIRRGVEQARSNSWESIVSQMERIIATAVRTRESRTTRTERVADRAPVHRHSTRTAALATAGEEAGS